MNIISIKKPAILVAMGVVFTGYSDVYAVNLNYEGLSFLEKPIATHVGDTTLEVNGLVDGAVIVDGESETDTQLTGEFQASAETQLSNSITVGATYFGEYSTGDDSEYEDSAAVYASGVWGTGSLGDVTGLVQEETSRQTSAGNASLAFDEQLGELQDKGATFIGRVGPTKYGVTVDEDSNFSVVTVYQRPIGNKDYRFSFNVRDSEYESSDASTVFDSQGAYAVAALTYGSTIYDVGIGVEKLTAEDLDLLRKYISAGVSHKIGVVTLSAEAHVGDIEGQSEVSYAVGASYDIARGLSLNLGVNHVDSQVTVDGVEVVNADDTEAILSVTYRF